METGTTQPRGTGRGGNSGGQRGTSKVEERSTRTRRAGRKSRLITTIVAISAFLGAASPAAGDDLVSNMGLPDLPLGSNSRFENFDFAQSFSTGANVSGYQLESISLYFADPSDHATDPVYVSLHQDDGNGRPGAQVTELTKNGINYAGPVRGVNKYNVWKARCYPQPPHGGAVSTTRPQSTSLPTLPTGCTSGLGTATQALRSPTGSERRRLELPGGLSPTTPFSRPRVLGTATSLGLRPRSG